jgi:thiol:disulfide interchange protein DsbD
LIKDNDKTPMRKIILIFLITLGVTTAMAQTPVTWNFTTRKIDNKTYELHLTAVLQTGWHLYSQTQPDDAIAVPTGIKFNINPLLKLDGKITEVGKLEKFKDIKLGVSAHQYSKKVDFVQLVKLKTSAKTNISGSVEYQTCDDKKCLPPKTVNFSVAIN